MKLSGTRLAPSQGMKHVALAALIFASLAMAPSKTSHARGSRLAPSQTTKAKVARPKLGGERSSRVFSVRSPSSGHKLFTARQQRRVDAWKERRAHLAASAQRLESHRAEYLQIPTHGSLIAERHIAAKVAEIDALLPALKQEVRRLDRRLGALH